MAAIIESSSGKIKTVEREEDITTCCICTEVYTDPKALPCIHTFCMKCLQENGLKTNKGPGDEMPCPICRRMFKIPTEGFHGLPNNVFIEKLIQVSKVSDPSTVSRASCSVCLEDSKEDAGKETPTADAYCVDCKHKLCEECCSEHRKFKLTKNHKLIPINEYESDQYLMSGLAPMVCEVHEHKVLDVYCTDCKTVVCAICFIEEHKNHEGSHVNKCVDGFRKQIQNNTETMNECISQAQMKKAEIMKVKEEMQERVESIECDVEKRKDEIKQLSDKHASSLLQGLCSERQSKLKEIKMATDDIDAYLSYLESYKSYCQRIMDKGSASDICRAISDLSVGAFELQQQCQPTIERKIPDFKFCFRQFELQDFVEEDCGNLIGEIEEEGEVKPMERSKRIRSVNNDKLKQNLDTEKMTNNSLQAKNDNLVEELNRYKATVKALDTNAEKLRKELKTTKADNRQKISITEQKQAQQRETWMEEQEKLMKQIKEQHRLIAELRYKLDPVFVQAIRTKAAQEKKKDIRGLTILDKELFVVSEESSEVEVYNSMELSLNRRWNLKTLIDPSDIASCNRNKCLYIFDYKGDDKSREILRVDPIGKLINKWSTGVHWGWGLSVTDESNVILALYNENTLHEYSPIGQLIREIILSSDAGFRHPWHGIRLTNGHFMVSHGDVDDLNRICVVNGDGKLQKSFGGRAGFTIGQLGQPVHFFLDGNGFVMVADESNSRVFLLDSDLKFKKEILPNLRHGLRSPWKILLDESNGRLFVADNEEQHRLIFIFDFK